MLVRMRLIALALVAGCAQPASVMCGETLCPVGSVCSTDGRCATPAEVAACGGKVDGEACTLASGAPGECQGGACTLVVCGNGFVEGSEACDDGNTASGDGCRADCAKVERCDDGVVDQGEACDDGGNDNRSDGCDHCMAVAWRATTV